uniref:tyrosine-protein kinase Tec-like n=1 Tax=Myxine glutinosa TaxID=7769 RepID=UPI00358ED41A
MSCFSPNDQPPGWSTMPGSQGSVQLSKSCRHPLQEGLLSEILVKRSQQRRIISPLNYKERFFILTKSALSYHECNMATQKVGNRKGSIALTKIKCVEKVLPTAEITPDKKFPFQVVHDNGCLYVFSPSEDSQTRWVKMLQKEISNNTTLALKYHPCFWIEGEWLCCQQTARNAIGCKEYQLPGPEFFNDEISEMQNICQSPKLPPLPPIPISPTPFPSSPQANGSQSKTSIPFALALSDFPALPPPPPPCTPPPPPPCTPPPPVPMFNQLQLPPNLPVASIPELPYPSHTELPVVVALYHFSAQESNDLSLVVGQEYELLDSTDSQWWHARDSMGREGFIPSAHVIEKTYNNLEAYEWYSKNISRNKAEELLKQEGKEGSFIVRDSSQAGFYTVSIYSNSCSDGGVVKHYQVREVDKTSKKYYLAEKYLFDSIPVLINYHMHNSAGLVSRLRHPVCTRSGTAPTTAGFSYNKWEINPKELTIQTELGNGQFGVVKKGKWRGQCTVAIKMIREGSMSEDDFIQEARSMMKLCHPKLVQLYGVCTQRRPIYIVTEFMEGGCLESYLRRRRTSLRLPTLLEMGRDACEAMQYLEANGFIHRDLAARNCLVNAQNTVKVSDFGMTRYVLDDQYTSSSGTKFPVRWSAVEVFLYCKFSSKSDVWSFGVLLWEIFSGGAMPYETWNNNDVVELVQKGHRLAQPDKAPAEVYNVMRSCWQMAPEERPSFRDLLNSINSIMEKD